MNSKRGYSLLEVVSCLAIVTIIGGIGFPEIYHFQESLAVRESGATLLCDLNRLRSEAVKENSYAVLVYKSSGYAGFLDDGAGGGKRGDWIQQPGELTLFSRELSKAVSIDLAKSTFKDNRTRIDGQAIAGRAGTIYLSSASGEVVKVILSVSGRARVTDS